MLYAKNHKDNKVHLLSVAKTLFLPLLPLSIDTRRLRSDKTVIKTRFIRYNRKTCCLRGSRRRRYIQLRIFGKRERGSRYDDRPITRPVGRQVASSGTSSVLWWIRWRRLQRSVSLNARLLVSPFSLIIIILQNLQNVLCCTWSSHLKIYTTFLNTVDVKYR